MYLPQKKQTQGCIPRREGQQMSFGIYIVGYIILIIGLAIGAHLLHVPQKWIGVGVLCLIGIAIIHGVTATREKDSTSQG
jgi:uncharacterized membrane protein YiaA